MLRAVLFACMLLFTLASGARERLQVAAFRKGHACPSTAQHHGACPGFEVDHVRPLCSGGEDRPSNMQWISVADHRFKTLVDVRECRKLLKAAATPAK
jgi:hypothetical protein